jgi:hypothetical protein
MQRDELFVDEAGKHEARIISWNNEWVYFEMHALGCSRWRRVKLSRQFWESPSNGWRKAYVAT